MVKNSIEAQSYCFRKMAKKVFGFFRAFADLWHYQGMNDKKRSGLLNTD